MLAEGKTDEPRLVLGPPRLLCFSPNLSAGSLCRWVCGCQPCRGSGRSIAGGRGEERRRDVPCSSQAAGMGWEGRFSWSMWIIEGGCLEALPVTVEMGWGRNVGGRSGDLRAPDSKPPVRIPLSCPRHPPSPPAQLLVQALSCWNLSQRWLVFTHPPLSLGH